MSTHYNCNPYCPQIVKIRKFLREQGEKDKQAAAKIGLTWRTSMGALYYLLLDMWAISPEDARASGLFNVLWLWLGFIEISDALLDNYGHALPDKYLSNILKEFSHDKINFPEVNLVHGLISSDIKLEQIKATPIKILRGAETNPVYYMETFFSQLNGCFEKYPQIRARRRSITSALVKNSLKLFKSYTIEHKYYQQNKIGTPPTRKFQVSEQLLKEKTNFRGLVTVGFIFTNDWLDSEKKQQLFCQTVLLSQVFDDLIDFENDSYSANIFLSFAEFYPKEKLFLFNAYTNGSHFFGIKRQLTLLINAPRSVFRTCMYIGKIFFDIFRYFPVFATTLFSIWVLKYIRKRIFRKYERNYL